MNQKTKCIIGCLMAITSWIGSVAMADQDVDKIKQDAERDFTLNVLPVLRSKCLGCHGGDPADIKGDLSVVDREALLRGGESGDPTVVPGEPGAGTMLSAIRWESMEMPPKENDRLSEKQIAEIQRWIEQGAPWPDEAAQQHYRDLESQKKLTADGMIVSTSGGLSQDWTNRRYAADDLWAYAPLPSKQSLAAGDVPLPAAIDFYVDRQLEEAELQASGQAAPRDLLRRASLDLTGLPPTPKQQEAFLAAWQHDSEAAWSALIDRLLASPEYGERWGRHWLDVTRYADTGGMANDYERSNMWRYRDYVIRSLNDDKPYDQFVVEQLAGDELADLSVRERTGGDAKMVHQVQVDGEYTSEEAEWIVATGFLRMGPWDNAMIEAEEARQIYLDDLVNITGQAFLSTTMRCFKCHDHKFDPLPTRDYYRMYAAFATTRMAERTVPALPSESREGFAEGRAHVQRMLDFAVAQKKKLVDKREAAARAWFKEHDLPYKNESDRKSLPDEEKPERHVGLTVAEQGELKVREQDEWIWTRRLERYQPMAQSVFNAEGSKMAWNGARKLRIHRLEKSKPLTNHILLGGALTALGETVMPGVLSAVSLPVNPAAEDPFLLTPAVDGRRLELARWIVHRDNGLAVRSIVNRVWQYHFGTGLAANSINFGVKGAKPSHPELLDYLAVNFVENGWTLKRLHRAIMQSQTYRRSTAITDRERVGLVDPGNQLLSHFPRRRLTAEELRDGLLQITGELQSTRGGLPVMPEINMEVALQPRMIQFSLAPAYQPSPTPELRNRRTIYAYHVRGQSDPFTELFNQPNSNETCEMRESASVTPQVFGLLNSDMITDRSIALALRLQREHETVADQITRAMQMVLGREPTSGQRQQLTQYVRDMQAYHEEKVPAAVRYPTQITRSLVEEFSGDVFEYQEILPVFEEYVPDAKASDVSAATRALADACLLLFNSNEFMYVE